jgi:site-specific DNA-cytosine methylase
MKNDIVLVPYKETDGMIFCGYFEGHLLLKNGNPLLSRTHKQPYRIYHANGISQAMAASETQGRYYIMEDVKSEPQIIQAGTIVYPDHSGEHQQDFVQHADGISRVIPAGTHASTPHLLKTYIPMADKNAIELPSELKGKKFRIRKLTPRECFRLMGVDDKDVDKIQAAGVSNSAQYKLAGNSIVVDPLFHLFRKMFIETDEEKAKEGQQFSFF